MLEKIALMDSQVIRALLVAVVGLLGMVLSFFGIDEKLFDDRGAKLVDALLLVLTAGGVAYAAYARATKPNPPLTNTAVDNTLTYMAKKQGGFARAFMLGLMLAICVPVFVATLPACTSLQPLSFDQKLKLSIDTQTAVVNAVKNALNAGQITSDQAESFYKVAVEARHISENAVALKGSDVKSAEGQLQLANDLLLRLQEYLTAKEKANG